MSDCGHGTSQKEPTFADPYTRIAWLHERVDTLRSALEELLDVAERSRAGDPKLDPEEWHAIRDFARVTLKREA